MSCHQWSKWFSKPSQFYSGKKKIVHPYQLHAQINLYKFCQCTRWSICSRWMSSLELLYKQSTGNELQKSLHLIWAFLKLLRPSSQGLVSQFLLVFWSRHPASSPQKLGFQVICYYSLGDPCLCQSHPVKLIGNVKSAAKFATKFI